MKGVILSLAVLAGYVVFTAGLSHIFRPRRHSRLFPPAFALFCLIYGAAYRLTPQDLYCLPAAWIAGPAWLDALAGLVMLTLNYFSYIDCFFGLNGGFSMSLMHELLRAENRGLSTEELLQRYRLSNEGIDKIFAWRIPRLEETGYIVRNSQTGIFEVTRKGRVVAWGTMICKRLLNLGAGG